jgi:AcrR family transcriptional regulator
VNRPAKTAPAAPKPATRIQRRNRKLILDGALEVFSAQGFRGSTIDQIAARAGLSKPNLLYYFPSKRAIYAALLEDILSEWLQPLADLDPRGDPVTEIGRYVEAKLAISRVRPEASRLFASEVLHGAPTLRDFLGGPLKTLVDQKGGGDQRLDRRGSPGARRPSPSHLHDLGGDAALRGLCRPGALHSGRESGLRAGTRSPWRAPRYCRSSSTGSGPAESAERPPYSAGSRTIGSAANCCFTFAAAMGLFAWVVQLA